jgi:hypothetical protein
MTTLVGSAKGTNTATAPAHQVGDLMLVVATRNASNTAPSLPAGFSNIGTSTGNTNAMRAGWKYCLTTSDATGTWTTATETIVAIYRPTAGRAIGIGAFAFAAGSSATASYTGITLQDAGGNSWVALFGQTKTQSVGINTAPTGFTPRQDELGTGELAFFDTNGGVSSFTTKTQAITSGVWKTFSVEILDVAPGASINNIVCHVSYAYDTVTADPNPGNSFVYTIPDKLGTLAGNGLLIGIAYPSGNTLTITDDQSNSWPAPLVTSDGGAGNSKIEVYRLTTATTGTKKITLTFSAAVQPVKLWVTELFNVTGTLNSTSAWHAENVNASDIVSPGAQTPTNNDANGGNLIFSFACANSLIGTKSPAKFIAAPGYTLNDGDIAYIQGQGFPTASQFFLQATSAATTPEFLVQGTADTYNVAAVAVSIGVQGLDKSNGSQPHIDKLIYMADQVNPTNLMVQIPSSTSNFGLFTSFNSSNSGPTITSALDSDGVTWTKRQNSVDQPTFFSNTNQAPNSNKTVVFTFGGTGLVLQFLYYDISGADPTSPVDVVSGTSPVGLTGAATFSSNTITPSGQNELIVGFGQLGLGPSTGLSSPTGAVYDLPTYRTAQFTAAITAGVMTVTDITTGGNFGSLAAGLIESGAGVSAGNTITTFGTGTGGPGTYNMSIPDTVGSITMFQSNTDSDTMAFGNIAGHYWNGNSTAAETWTANIANQNTPQSNSGTWNLIAIKAASTTTPAWGWDVQNIQPPNPMLSNLALNNRRASALNIGDIGIEGPQINFVNPGWHIQPPQPPHPRPEKLAALVGGDPGHYDIQRIFFQFGWPIQPPQPPHPRPEKFAALTGGDPGHYDTQRLFFQFGWPIQPWQPPNPATANLAMNNRTAAIMRGDDGSEGVQISFLAHGWPTQPPQPPHPRSERFGALAAGDQGNEAALVNFNPAGWEIQPPPPPHPRPERGAAIFIEPNVDVPFNLPITAATNGWWVQDVQPPHPRSERAGAIMPGINLDATFIVFYPMGWEIQPPPPPHFRKERNSAIMPQSNVEAVLASFFPMGWEVQPPPPPHPRPEKTGALMVGDQGIYAKFIAWYNTGWEIQPPPPPHPRPERAGALMPQSNIDEIFVTAAPPPVLWDNLPPVVIHPRPERAGVIMAGDSGIQATFVNWRNAGWEVQPPPPPHRRIERAGAIMAGEPGIQARFIVWKNAGWEIQSVQPPHPRPEKVGGIMLGDSGIYAKFTFVPVAITFAYDVSFTLRYPVSRRRAAIYIGNDGIEAVFVPPPIPPPPIPPRPIPPAFIVLDPITQQFDGSDLHLGQAFTLLLKTYALPGGTMNLYFISPSGVIVQANSNYIFAGLNQIVFGQMFLLADEYVVYPTTNNELDEQGTWGVYLQTGVFTTSIGHFEIGPP